MIVHILKSKYFNFQYGFKNLSIKLLQLSLIILSIVLFYFVIKNPEFTQTIKITNHFNIYLLSSFLFLFIFSKFHFFEHKSLLLLPVKRSHLTFLTFVYAVMKYQSIFLAVLSYMFIVYNYSNQSRILDIIAGILLTLLFIFSILSTKLAFDSASKYLFDYFPIVVIAAIFLFAEYISLHIIIFIVLLLVSGIIFKLNANIINIILRAQNLRSRYRYSPTIKLNILLDKEIKLIFRHKKRKMFILAFIFLIIFGISDFLFPSSTNDFLIFLYSGGIMLSEYFHYIFSWDHKNIGTQIVFPIQYTLIIKNKLFIIRTILLLHAILAFVILMFLQFNRQIIVFFILNVVFLPHIYLLISLHNPNRKLNIDHGMINKDYNQRINKIYIIASVIYIMEFIILLLNVNLFSLYFLTFLGISIVLIILLEKKLISFYSRLYIIWLQKYFNDEEENFVF